MSPSTPSIPPAPALDRPGQAVFFAAAAGVLGHAIMLSNGHQDPNAMQWVTVALVLSVVGVAMPNLKILEKLGDRPLRLVIGLGLIWSFGQLMHNSPGIYLRARTPEQVLAFHMALSAGAVLAGLSLADMPLLGKWQLPLLVLVHLYLGWWLITASPAPIIDVDTMQREGVKELLHGGNPYAMTFPNIYGHTKFFGAGVATADRINEGFPYPPLSLFMAVPGQAFFGDYRYGQLAAMSGAAIFMAMARPGTLGTAIAALFLFTPRAFFVLEQGWTDPFLVLMISATVFVALRRPGLIPYVFALFVCLKQYAVLSVIFSWMLLRPFSWREFGKSALKSTVVIAVISLPLALWDFKPFIFTLVLAHLQDPFRMDALTYIAWMGNPQGAGRLTLAALAIAIGLSVWRSPRTPAGFASTLVLFYFAFFAFGAHAFCNHYYFLIGLLCVAAAATKLTPDAEAVPTDDPVMAFFSRLKSRSGKAPATT